MHDADPVGESWPTAPVGLAAGLGRRRRRGTRSRPRRASTTSAGWTPSSKTARAHHAQPLIVLGQTPTFHSTQAEEGRRVRTGRLVDAGPGGLDGVRAAVVERYNAPDVAFQVWNEANVEGYWSGTPKQMARLTAAAREVVDAATPMPTLVAPAMAVRTAGPAGLDPATSTASKVSGVPVADLVDVVSLQLYPEVGEGPSARPALLAEAPPDPGPAGRSGGQADLGHRGQLRRCRAASRPTPRRRPRAAGQRGDDATCSTRRRGAARVLVLVGPARHRRHRPARGGQRDPDAGRRGLRTVQRWLLGSKVTRCRPMRARTYLGLRAADAARAGRVYWNPGHTRGPAPRSTRPRRRPSGEPAQELPLGGTHASTVGDRAGAGHAATPRAGPSLPPRL